MCNPKTRIAGNIDFCLVDFDFFYIRSRLTKIRDCSPTRMTTYEKNDWRTTKKTLLTDLFRIRIVYVILVILIRHQFGFSRRMTFTIPQNK